VPVEADDLSLHDEHPVAATATTNSSDFSIP
jgi:hypothetical protein